MTGRAHSYDPVAELERLLLTPGRAKRPRRVVAAPVVTPPVLKVRPGPKPGDLPVRFAALPPPQPGEDPGLFDQRIRSAERILQAVAGETGQWPGDILGRGVSPGLALARVLFVQLARQFCSLSNDQIGRLMNRRWGSTVSKLVTSRAIDRAAAEAALARLTTVLDRQIERLAPVEPAGPAPVPCPPPPAGPVMRLASVVEATAVVHRIAVRDMVGPRRFQALARARQVGMFLARRHCGNKSLSQIGEAFGGRDHSTVLHGIQAVERRFGDYRVMVEAIEAMLGVGQ